jgi:uncharacterized protein
MTPLPIDCLSTVVITRLTFGSYRRLQPGWRFLSAALLSVALLSVLCLTSHDAPAQTQKNAARQQQQPTFQKQHNDGALMILGGHPGTTYFSMARDIAAALGGNEELRLLPIDTGGGTENLRDLLYLRGVDMALLPSNALVQVNATAMFGANLSQRLTYITQLYSEEVHVLVRPDILSFEQLRGMKIAVPPRDGNAEFTFRDLLRRNRMQVEMVRMSAPDAIDEVRSGALAGLVLTGAKPLRVLASLPKDGSLRLLAMPPIQGDGYSPAAFRSDDYPTLIPDGQTVDTVSFSTLLVTNNTPKWDESHRRISKFVPAFFGVLTELAGPRRHPKWSEVNLAATLVGWTRFDAAEEWLAKAQQEQAASVRKGFEQFLSATRGPGAPALSPNEQKELFEEFTKWSRRSMGTPKQVSRP